MPCCQGQDYDEMFDEKTARRQLRRYDRRGPGGETRRLIRALDPLLAKIPKFTHLDIGGGVGVLQHEFARRGAVRVTAVDASVPYLSLLEQAASKRGYLNRQVRVSGDFTEVADTIEPASVVTLDKVLCCYPNMPLLVRASTKKAQALYGIVVPRDTAWIRLGSRVSNWFVRKLLRWNFRSFIHPLNEIDRVVLAQGLTLDTADSGIFWSVRVYRRPLSLSPVDASFSIEGDRC